MLPATALAASPDVSHGQFDIIGEETNANICGDWGLPLLGHRHVHGVDLERGPPGASPEGLFTPLIFLDEPQETWDSRFVQAFTFHATPGGTTVQTFALNSFEGADPDP